MPRYYPHGLYDSKWQLKPWRSYSITPKSGSTIGDMINQVPKQQPPQHRGAYSVSPLIWPADAELVGITLELLPFQTGYISPTYSKGLHAWFLDEVRQRNPELSKWMHDEQGEKGFTLSLLQGPLRDHGGKLQVSGDEIYQWTITALNADITTWLARWIQEVPTRVALRGSPFQIKGMRISHRPTTYLELIGGEDASTRLSLSFLSATSFRQKGHHLPLPIPRMVFQSYLRRWNLFSSLVVDTEPFLEWVEESVLLLRHELHSDKVQINKDR